MNFKNLEADLNSQPITGYLPDGRHINIPLISHIADNLYVGGCMHGVDLGDFFSHVFSMYKWEQYKVAPATKVHTVTMYDGHNGVDKAEIDDLATRVVKALDAGGNVLVHCQAGINRSNLVAAAALMKKFDYSAEDAIALLRHKRSPLVLANRTFEKYLLGV